MSKSPAASSKGSRWWWVAWLILGIAFAVQAVRMRVAEAAVADGQASTAALVRPQNAEALALLADRQLTAGDAATAANTSVEALARAPMLVPGVRTLAVARQELGDTAGAEAAWQVASAMGWRDRKTQLWALLRALSNGEAEVFVMRADALMRTERDDPRMLSLIRQALIEPQIRRSFIQRITADPQWRLRLFTLPGRIGENELDATIQTLMDLGETAKPPQRSEVRDSILALIAAGRNADAVALDREFVARPRDPGSLIDDGGFERLPDYREEATPFDWTIVRAASLDRSGGRRSMLVLLDGRRRPLVRRFVALTPGRYQISYSIDGNPEAGSSIGFRIFCATGAAELASSPRSPLPGEGSQKRSFDFTVPGNCPLVRLDLTTIGNSDSAEALIDDVVLRPSA
ncbi:MAG: hypothetical protein M3Q52_05240 [Pseudomonadota bacterium]|nr:hypothetical protein [Pseudomonadota bacterium]